MEKNSPLGEVSRWWNRKGRQKSPPHPSPPHTKEVTTANAPNPENALKAVEQTTYTWGTRRPHRKEQSGRAMTKQDPIPASIPAHRQKEKERIW